MSIVSWSLATCLAGLVLSGLLQILVFSDIFHAVEHQRLKTAQRFTQAAPMSVVSHLQAYWRSPSLELIQHPLFSYRERLHYQEIKHLLTMVNTGRNWTLAGCLLFMLSMLKMWQSQPRGFSNALIGSAKQSALLLMGVVLVGSVMTLNFETQFLRLHLLIFDSRNWLLPSYAATVKLFPMQYFLDFSRVYAASVAMIAMLIWGLASGVNWASQFRWATMSSA